MSTVATVVSVGAVLSVIGVACVVCCQAATVYCERRHRAHLSKVLSAHAHDYRALNARRGLIEQQRDGYADALADVVACLDEGDVDGALARARHALDRDGLYTGELTAARRALEETQMELYAAMAGCLCGRAATTEETTQ